MNITEIKVNGYEKVIRAEDEASGLKAIIAVHNTNLGPAVGGTRLYPYASEEDAMTDVLRLSRGMTYKSSLAGLNFGGGKSVIIARPEDKSPALFEAFGRAVDSLGGKYICAEDVNTTTADMAIVHKVTPNVLGLEGGSGDPSPLTALGVVESIRATARHLGLKMNGLKVAMQGVGHVGWVMTEMLRKDGATVYITDVRQDLVKELAAKTGAIPVALDDIMTMECDIYAPCAMGATLNDKTIPALKCKAVVGCANNQLAEPRHGKMLQDRGILYAPDFLVNAGGIINVYFEYQKGGYDVEVAQKKVRAIGDQLMRVYALSNSEKITPAEAADRLAEDRFFAPRAAQAS